MIAVVGLIVLMLLPAQAFSKGKPVVETTNNLSFPAIAVDGFSISPVLSSFNVPYVGTYPELTTEEIDALIAVGPWYAQQTAGNVWQAEFKNGVDLEDRAVTYVDWGDNIESINPKVRRPFRLEVTLYKELTEPMTAYKMAVLEYPSETVNNFV